MNRRIRLSLVALLALASAACSTTRPLMPTPHLYSEGHAKLFGNLAPELKTSTIPVFYVTDRAPERDEEGIKPISQRERVRANGPTVRAAFQ